MYLNYNLSQLTTSSNTNTYVLDWYISKYTNYNDSKPKYCANICFLQDFLLFLKLTSHLDDPTAQFIEKID